MLVLNQTFQIPRFLGIHVPQLAILKYLNKVTCYDPTFGDRKLLKPDQVMNRTPSRAYPVA